MDALELTSTYSKKDISAYLSRAEQDFYNLRAKYLHAKNPPSKLKEHDKKQLQILHRNMLTLCFSNPEFDDNPSSPYCQLSNILNLERKILLFASRFEENLTRINEKHN